MAPVLSRENADAWQLWTAVQTQWRGSGLGIIGLDYNVLYAEAARLEIELTACTMDKIRTLEMDTLTEMNKDK